MSDQPKGQMKVQEVDVAGDRRRRRIKIAGLSVGSLVVVALGGLLAWYFTPPAMPTTLDEALALADSPRYERLSMEQKQPYLDVIREQFGSLNREERRAMMGEDEAARDMARDAMRGMFMNYAKTFGAASFEERQAMLANMPERPRRPEGQQRPEGEGRDPGAMRDRMSDRMANGNAQSMANMGEMIRARRAQREQN